MKEERSRTWQEWHIYSLQNVLGSFFYHDGVSFFVCLGAECPDSVVRKSSDVDRKFLPFEGKFQEIDHIVAYISNKNLSLSFSSMPLFFVRFFSPSTPEVVKPFVHLMRLPLLMAVWFTGNENVNPSVNGPDSSEDFCLLFNLQMQDRDSRLEYFFQNSFFVHCFVMKFDHATRDEFKQLLCISSHRLHVFFFQISHSFFFFFDERITFSGIL